MNTKARRATVYRDETGEWRYKVQGANWRTIDVSDRGFRQKGVAVRRVAKRWPGVEIVSADGEVLQA